MSSLLLAGAPESSHHTVSTSGETHSEHIGFGASIFLACVCELPSLRKNNNGKVPSYPALVECDPSEASCGNYGRREEIFLHR